MKDVAWMRRFRTICPNVVPGLRARIELSRRGFDHFHSRREKVSKLINVSSRADCAAKHI